MSCCRKNGSFCPRGVQTFAFSCEWKRWRVPRHFTCSVCVHRLLKSPVSDSKHFITLTFYPWALVENLSQDQNSSVKVDIQKKKIKPTKQKYLSFRPEWLSVSWIKMTFPIAVIMKLLLRADSRRTTAFFFCRWSSVCENTDPSRYQTVAGKCS